MAEEPETTDDGDAASGKKGGMLIWIVVMVISIVGGAATPIVIAGLGSGDEKTDQADVVELDPEEEFEFIEFDEVTVNLDEARFSRYLRVNFALQVGKSQMVEVQKQLDAKTTICKNWLQTHMAEKSAEDLRGRYGRNRVRREIHDYFNEVLFNDGIERIQDVLILEFNVQ